MKHFQDDNSTSIIDDYEFNTFSHWRDEDKSDIDDYEFNTFSHWKEDVYDDYETHIGCNYKDDY